VAGFDFQVSPPNVDPNAFGMEKMLVNCDVLHCHAFSSTISRSFAAFWSLNFLLLWPLCRAPALKMHEILHPTLTHSNNLSLCGQYVGQPVSSKVWATYHRSHAICYQTGKQKLH
jgi:hypothetical protein